MIVWTKCNFPLNDPTHPDFPKDGDVWLAHIKEGENEFVSHVVRKVNEDLYIVGHHFAFDHPDAVVVQYAYIEL